MRDINYPPALRYLLAVAVVFLALLLMLGLLPFNGVIVGGLILLVMVVAFL